MVLNLSVPELKELKPKITVFGVGVQAVMQLTI